jgi:hypothetical protein
MTSPIQSIAHLSDDELLATVKHLVTTECRATAALVRSLMELDVRRLYLGQGYSSLFTYARRRCTSPRVPPITASRLPARHAASRQSSRRSRRDP